MNIKSLTPTITSLDSVTKTDGKEKVRFQKSTDRDANGRQEREPEQRAPEYTDEEWESAVETLKKLPAVLKNNLQVISLVEGSRRFVKIVSFEGETIRRLSESDVWASLQQADLEEPKGQLLNKAM